MNKKIMPIFLMGALLCTLTFLGCATVPQETLDEKEAVIKNLNNQIDSLRQEIDRLKSSNEELMNANRGLEEKLRAPNAEPKMK